LVVKKQDKFTSFAGKLFLIGLFLGGAWYLVKGTIIDDSALSGEFESSVNEVLSNYGIEDKHLLKTVRKERKATFPIPAAWIETEREILLPPGTKLSELVMDIKLAGSQLNILHFSENYRDERTVLECGKKKRTFQRLIFIKTLKIVHADYQVAIVIDDVAGRPSDTKNLEPFLALGIPLTYAVLPMEKISRSLAEKIHRSGGEVIIHQPMEPHDLENNDPGKAAILVHMGRADLRGSLKRNLASVPHAVGISNHMGSRFTSDPKAMRLLLTTLKEMGEASNSMPLFFFDSHTTANLAGKPIAKELGLNYLLNDIFLDNEDVLESILKQMELLKKRAKKKKSVTAIGHIQKKFMAKAIRKSVAKFKEEGIEFVLLSQLVRKRAHRVLSKAP